MDYRRGRLDTLARKASLFVRPTASYRYVSKDGRRDLRLRASHTRSSADLLDRITYRDDSAPLVVKLGNPDLKGNVTSSLGADYYDKEGRRQR